MKKLILGLILTIFTQLSFAVDAKQFIKQPTVYFETACTSVLGNILCIDDYMCEDKFEQLTGMNLEDYYIANKHLKESETSIEGVSSYEVEIEMNGESETIEVIQCKAVGFFRLEDTI